MRFTFSILLPITLVLFSCGPDTKQDSLTNPTGNNGIDDNKSEGEKSERDDNDDRDSKPETDPFDRLHSYCRIDESDNKKYCINFKKKMPSDLNPEKSIGLCSSGIMHSEECLSMKLKANNNTFQIYAGNHLRASGSSTGKLELDRLSARRVDTYSKMRSINYMYTTKFDHRSFDYYLFGDAKIFTDEFIAEGYTIEIHQEYYGDQLKPRIVDQIAVEFKGFPFKTGPMTVTKFKELCETFSKISPSEIDPWEYSSRDTSSNEHGCYRRVLGSLRLRCDNNNQHCQLYEIRLPFGEI